MATITMRHREQYLIGIWCLSIFIVEEWAMFQFTIRNSRSEFARFMWLNATRHKLSHVPCVREAMAYSELVGTSFLSLRTRTGIPLHNSYRHRTEK